MPEALAERAALLEQPALALLDRDGLYGAPRFYRAATRVGINPLVGAEVTLAEGGRLPLLVESPEGYQNLCRLITKMKMRAEPASHLPRTTFCWLPPLSKRTAWTGVALMRRSLTIGVARSNSQRRGRKP